MNIESKARAGFTSIMLRGGRMTKWKGQVASYAPHVGHLQNVSVAAMAAALAFGGSMALPSEALAQDVTVTVTDPQVPVDVTNNGNGSLIINAPNGVTGKTTAPGIKATNGPNAEDIIIDVLTASGTSGMVVDNDGTGFTSITADRINGSTLDGVNVTTNGSGVSIIANQISAGNVGVFVNNQGSGDVVVDVANFVRSDDGNIAEITVGENGGSIDLSFGSASGNDEGIFVDSDSTDGGITIAVNGNLVVEGNEAFQGTGIDASIDSGTNTGNLIVSTGNVSAANGVSVANAGQGFINVQSVGQLLGAGGFGVDAQQTGEGAGITINADSIIANDSGVTVGMTNGQGVINVTADSVFAVSVSSDPNAINLFNLDANGQFIADQTQVGVSVAVDSADAGNINVGVTDVTAGTGIVVENGGSGSVTITDFDQILALAGQGISVTQDGAGGQGITINGQTIESQTTGVNILASFGQGDIDVDVDSIEVEDGLSSGVSIVASSTGAGNILVNVPDITAGSGIDIINSGEGYALVESFGQILASSGNGISVTQNGAGEGVTINANVIDAASDGIAASLTSGNGGVSISAVDVTAGSNGISTYNNSGGASTILVGGSIEAGDNAINAINGANASDLTITGTDVAATIIGGASGIYARNNGTGVTLVSVAGAVTGTAGIGIDVQNGGDAKGISISAADVDGRVRGINAQNDGEGNIDISVSGTVNSLLGQGINADNGSSGSSLSIKANVINAATSGIIANNDGNYDTSVTTYGAVDAAAGDGIKVTNGATARNLTVDARADVTGGTDGIDVVNNGVGSTEVNVAANVKGNAGNAISVVNNGATKGLTITANNATATIDGDGFGIYAQNSGGGDTKISVAGTVTADRFDGISAFNAGTAGSISISAGDVTGNYNGIAARNYGTGTTTIAVSGIVTGGTDYNGIFAYNGEYTNGTAASATNAGTGLTITSTKVSDIVNGVAVPTISGDNHGIYAKNLGAGATTLSVAGAIKAASGDGIFVENGANSLGVSINAASVSGGDDGIIALNNGANDTVISATDVDGKSGIGIYAKNAATANSISVSALGITALTDGVKVQNDGIGAVTIAVTNTIAAGQDGVDAVNNGAGNLTIFTKSIVAGEEGIEAVNTGADLEIEAASILAVRNAILATNNGTGNTTLTLNGNVTGGAGFNAIEATNATTAGNLTIVSTEASIADAAGLFPATITGGTNGILAVNNSNKGGSTSITVAGKVVGTTADGINATNEAGTNNLAVNVNNVSGGLNGIDLTNIGSGSTTLLISGNVDGATENGIKVANADATNGLSIIANNGGSTISGEVDGINAANRGVGSMSISVAGDIIGRTGDGINLLNGLRSENLDIVVNKVTGDNDGIVAFNLGDGSTSLRATGKVTAGLTGDGMFVISGSSTTGLSVEAVDVSAGANGIFAQNSGSGSTFVKATGVIAAATAAGINVENRGDSKNLTVEANNVSGGEHGIILGNRGAGGNTSLTLGGNVSSGGGFSAIEVTNATTAENVTITAANAAATITGGTDGILVVNNGEGGSTTLTVAGKVVGAGYDGINVENGVGAVNLTVTANNVEALRTGIEALNRGTGSTKVISTGTVVVNDPAGFGNEGILVNNRNVLSVNAEVIANVVTGGTYGISVINDGTGFSSVTATGLVKGLNSAGISITGGQGSSNIIISAADVEGFNDGVQTFNYGTGSASITVSGNVTGGTGNGIDVITVASAKDLTITGTNAAATITGGVNGIFASNKGTGSTSITAAGKVIGTTGDGINARNEAGATNLSVNVNNVSGGLNGIDLTNAGAGFTTLSISGNVDGATENGIEIDNVNATSGLSIIANNGGSTIIGQIAGINAANSGAGSMSISVAGDIIGRTDDGVRLFNGSRSENLNIVVNNVTGNDEGISAFNNGDGSTSLRVTGKVTAGLTGDGIFVSNSSSTTDLSVEAVDVFAGANGIFAQNGGSGSTLVKATGAITATTADGINVENVGDSRNLTVEANNVSGGQHGIKLENKGAGGNTSLTVKGNVTGGTGFNAIEAFNAASAKNLVITAANAGTTITGRLNGVRATNEGVGGSTAVNIAGSVIGLSNDGIQVENKAGTTGLTLTANKVSGAENGIVAKNGGAGETLVTAIGDVVGTRGIGVDVRNNALATNIAVNTAKVSGGAVGVAAVNNGSGFTRVTATGDINGNDEGILSSNGVNAADLSVAAANVTATKLGVFADNAGKGATSVTLNGNVTGGAGFNAVDVRNGATAKDLTVTAGNAAGKIAGGSTGLNVLNNGKDASTSVLVAGSVAGTVDDGIHVESGADTLNVSVTVKDATGGDEAVEVINRGKGSTTVVASGALVGRDNGLVAANTATGTTLSVTAKDVTGAASGISTNSFGAGATTISVSGKIAGGTGAGISASNAAGTTATINLAATADVSATSGNAILNNGGNSVLNVANGAGLRGTVRLGDGSDTANFALASTEAFIGITALDGGDNVSAADGFVDTLNLNGVGNYDLVGARVTNWEAINIIAGTVGFSDAAIVTADLTVNAGGTLNAANSLVATANVTVAVNGTLQAGNAAGNSRTRIVGNLASAGLVNLSGPAGSAKAGDGLAITGNFTGNGGQVRLDTVLGGDNSPTDFVSITGNAVGGSLLAINNTGGLGGLTTGDGIRVVQVGGTSDRDAFALLGDDVQAGGFRYDLFLGGIADPNDQDWYLRTVGASDIAATTLSFARLSDDIAMTFLGTLHERVGEQEHLAKRGYQSTGTGGLWGRFVGKGFRERLSSATLGDIKSTGSISGLQMGLDFGRSIKSDGSATFTGAYAGYADGSSNDQNIFRNVARRSGSSDSKGWLTGLYATHYGSTGWYANAVVQATWVDASASARNGITLETDGRTYLGSVELGKSLKLGNRLAFETQAQLIYGETRFDDARDSAGIANKIRIEDSLTGRVGFRLKTTKDEKYNAAGGLFSGYLKANLWHNLLGSDVRLNTAGVDLGKFEPKKTWVDAGLGTTLTVAKNTELFFDADVEIGLDRKTAAGTGKAGLRINW